jgi:hypothetical protein
MSDLFPLDEDLFQWSDCGLRSLGKIQTTGAKRKPSMEFLNEITSAHRAGFIRVMLSCHGADIKPFTEQAPKVGFSRKGRKLP